MRFWHIVKDEEGLIREQFLAGNSNSRFSLECLAEILNGTYEVFSQSYDN